MINKTAIKLVNFFLATVFFLVSNSAFAVETIGDRLVISINNLPYTQRQVEVYMLVKESLRKNPSKKMLYVDKDNWYLALKIFAWDMLIEQEAARLGSFKVSQSGIKKYRRIVESRFDSDSTLMNRVRRLGIGDHTLVRTLGAALRVEAFRMSKEKQASLSKREKPKMVDAPEISKWLKELEERSVVRLYQNSNKYIQIQPTLGRQSGAL